MPPLAPERPAGAELRGAVAPERSRAPERDCSRPEVLLLPDCRVVPGWAPVVPPGEGDLVVPGEDAGVLPPPLPPPDVLGTGETVKDCVPPVPASAWPF
jgi:hypothetical protein